jgi:peptide/nickel transport system permease protein
MWELLIKSRKFMIALAVVGIMVMFGIIGPIVTRDPVKKDATRMAQPPSSGYLLGTTAFGEDIFAQLCMGIRNSLAVGVLAGALGTLIAVLFGALGPYKGGLADEISNFVTNIVIVFPVLPLLLILAAVLEQSIRSLFLVGVLIALTSWPWAARSIRSQVLSLKEREFVNLARMSGMKDRTMVITEVLPNMLAYIMMVFVLLAGGAIIAEAGISMLGVGPDPTRNVTLGSMLYWAMNQTVVPFWWNVWWWFIPPGLVLTVLLSAVFVMHAGMDELFNPRLRKM